MKSLPMAATASPAATEPPPISPARTCRERRKAESRRQKSVPECKNSGLQPSVFSPSGFTLLEILVALVIVAIAVSAALGSQINVLKIEQKSRALRIFRFETERIFSATRRAENEQHLAELLATNNLCRLKSAPLQIEDGTNVLTFTRHELNAEALPSFSSVFYIRPPAVSDPAAATDGKTLRSGR